MAKKKTDERQAAAPVPDSVEDLYTVTIKGLTPLVVNSARTMIEWAGMDKGSDKAEWERAHVADKLYTDLKGRVVLPMANLKASLVDACKFLTTKPRPPLRSWSPLVQSAIVIMDDAPIDEPWAPFGTTVGLNGRLNVRWRPRFLEWSSQFGIVVIDAQLTLPILEDLAYRAGRYVGIGDGTKIGLGRYRMDITPA